VLFHPVGAAALHYATTKPTALTVTCMFSYSFSFTLKHSI